MQGNIAYRIHEYGSPDVLELDRIPIPTPGPRQLLVKVRAAGVNSLDWQVRQGFVKDSYPMNFPATLGSELAGVVIAIGDQVARFKVGDRVMGPIGFGAYSNYVVVPQAPLCLIPPGLTDVQAAAIPVAALTAWQALHAAGALHPAQRVLIHGAAGGVGGFAVQFAKAAGAIVFATAATENVDYVFSLRADEVIDYQNARFEDRAEAIDLVLDLVGGETLDRSWHVLVPGGAVVSTTTSDIAERASAGARGIWLSMKPDADRLNRIASDVALGRLHSQIAEVDGIAGLPAAIELTRTAHAPGKIVIDFTR